MIWKSGQAAAALFRAGKLSWSKIRLIASVADKDTEKTLCHAALDAAVTDVKRLCDGYRWKENELDGAEDSEENDRALKQWRSRSLRWDELGNGSTRIQLILPPEIARAFLAGVEHSLNQLDQTDDAEATISQRRADAAVRMAETSLQAAGRDTATADRYQVIVSVNAAELAVSGTAPAADENGTPSRRATVNGAGIIARETARRIACDCSVTTHTTANGESTDIGRKSRLWPNAMARAVKDRDQHCQFYDCTQTQNLQIHHMIHWADGGSTSVSNGVCLCQGCHIRVKSNSSSSNGPLTSVCSTSKKSCATYRVSFNQVRKLLPTRYRFRVMGADGKDIRNSSSVNACRVETHLSSTPAHSTSMHSTRVECGKSVSGSCSDGEDDAAGHVAEQPAGYRFDTCKYQALAL